VVVRFQGGHNAGHTVKVGERTYAFHLIPSGALYPGKTCILANGVVVHPPTLLEEMDKLGEAGHDLTGRLWISDRAHLVMPYHPLLDIAREGDRGDKKIGTTSRGIGPAYEDKAGRSGLRVGDLLNPPLFRERTLRNVEKRNRILEAHGVQTLDPEGVVEEYLAMGKRMAPFIRDTVAFLQDLIDEGKMILLEGAQGTMLDVDHGTFPYVTSSNPSIGGAVGTGIGPMRIGEILMVLKAYSTRVGTGPFPTELDDALGDRIREAGKEFGTTTGRPRRCGWFDLVVARHSARRNDATGIVLTLLDVLDGHEEIKICTAYRIRGKEVGTFPSDPWDVRDAEPVYETVPGWEGSCAGVKRWDEMPQGAKAYVETLEERLKRPIVFVSTGPGRDQMIERR